MVGRQNADIADTLQLRGVAMATTFWPLMGYNFSCMIASDRLFDLRGWISGHKLSNEDIAEIEGLRDVAMATNFGTLTGDNDMRLTYGLFSVNPYVCWSLSGIVVAAIGTAPGGRLSGWELTR